MIWFGFGFAVVLFYIILIKINKITATDFHFRGGWYASIEAGILAASTFSSSINQQFVEAGAQPPLEKGISRDGCILSCLYKSLPRNHKSGPKK